MGVPKEIREVPRPKNTVVVDNGRDGPNRYAVRERAGTKYIPGHNPQPRNGKVGGYIVDGRFVPRIPNSSESRPTAKSRPVERRSTKTARHKSAKQSPKSVT